MMKKNNILSILTGALLLTTQASFGQYVNNGDFSTSSSSPEVADEWIANTNNYTLGTNINGSGSISYCTTTFLGLNPNSGSFVGVDGLDANPGSGALEVFRQENIAIPSGATNITFRAAARRTTQGGQFVVNIQVWLNNTNLGTRTISSNAFMPFNVPISGQVAGANNTLSFRQASFDIGGENDWAIDDIVIPCDGPILSTPEFTINGSSDNPLTICDPNDITLNITEDPDASSYFVAITNSNGVSHMRWLSGSELNPSNLANLDLVAFASNPALSTLDPTWLESESMDLVPGECYDIKVALQNECTIWVERVQRICIEEECSTRSLMAMDDLCNPLYLYASGSSTGNYFWDFGDGTSSTLKNPIHQYANAGTYTVTLLAYDITECGTCCDVSSMKVTIDCGDFTGETLTWSKEGEGERRAKGDTPLNSNPNSDFNGELNIYPNPAEDKANIAFDLKNEEVVNLKLFNSNGALVSTLINKTASSQGRTTISIDTGDLPAGIYHVALSTSSDRKAASFVVNK